MGSISAYFKRLDYLGDNTYYHEFLVWNRDQGPALILRGGPKSGLNFGIGSGGGSGVAGIDKPGSGVNLPFGSVLAAGPDELRPSKDYPKPGVVDPSEVIIWGPDSKLTPNWDGMVAESAKMNGQNVGYGFAAPDSNMFVTTVLQSAGLPNVKNNGVDDATPALGAVCR